MWTGCCVSEVCCGSEIRVVSAGDWMQCLRYPKRKLGVEASHCDTDDAGLFHPILCDCLQIQQLVQHSLLQFSHELNPHSGIGLIDCIVLQ